MGRKTGPRPHGNAPSTSHSNTRCGALGQGSNQERQEKPGVKTDLNLPINQNKNAPNGPAGFKGRRGVQRTGGGFVVRPVLLKFSGFAGWKTIV